MLLHCHNLSCKTTPLHALPCINHSKPNLNPNIITYKFHVSGHQRVLSPVQAMKDDDDGVEGRYRAKEPLARLYAAINNKSLSELLEVIRDEFSFMPLLIPIFHSFQEKKLMEIAMSISEKFNLHRDNDKARVSLMYFLLFLLTMAISFTLWKHFI
ncbi:hypothetical protein QJS10_CPB15g01543 [Acorus calamus]|uniref:Uncharacterized protein n=1 Tax=Acorus calamus TaxID=4465 RepID=A0AAV9D544_ACOCL|nr:hypothetical protein QJS10_CPB15g01543 [Acorus calamus]